MTRSLIDQVDVALMDNKSPAEEVLRKWRSCAPEGFDSRIQIMTIRSVSPVSGGVLYEGSCAASITAEDIVRLFAHPEFGSHGAWVHAGCFSIIRHND
jgi:hypothetical protein